MECLQSLTGALEDLRAEGGLCSIHVTGAPGPPYFNKNWKAYENWAFQELKTYKKN